MVQIIANGNATIDGIVFDDQSIRIVGDEKSIKQIEYGEYLLPPVVEQLEELIREPVDYWAAPEKPKPNTMKAAIVAVNSIWNASDITVYGSIVDDSDEPYVEGRFFDGGCRPHRQTGQESRLQQELRAGAENPITLHTPYEDGHPV